MSHHREPVTALGAPAAIGPYVHAIRVGGLLFCSGQIPLHPETGEMVGATAGEQVGRCLENLQAVCASAGASLADAVKITVYLRDMADFTAVNEVYASFFETDPPARVALAAAALPRDALVELDAIVALPDA
jgi:2-iminobutanoate/2-iminopropanoate deaminase